LIFAPRLAARLAAGIRERSILTGSSSVLSADTGQTSYAMIKVDLLSKADGEQVPIGLEAGNKIRLLKVFRQASE